jgi:hypothetical protein
LSERLRFVLVMAGGHHERHALPAGLSDAPATLCQVVKPGAWGRAGFTCRPDEIDCPACRSLAVAAVLELVRAS